MIWGHVQGFDSVKFIVEVYAVYDVPGEDICPHPIYSRRVICCNVTGHSEQTIGYRSAGEQFK